MRVVVAGTGLRPMHVLSIMKEEMPEIEFVGWYDPEPTNFERLGEGVPRYETVAAMLELPEDDPTDLKALDAIWTESEVTFGPDPNAGCPQVRDLLADMDIPVTQAPVAAE